MLYSIFGGMQMNRHVEISFLYDFYGQLLTEKQKIVLDYYYNDDLSLGEISEHLKITRQGVYDILRRSEKILYSYEQKLKLAAKFKEQQKKMKEIHQKVILLYNNEKIKDIDEIKEFIYELDKLLSNVID